MDFSIFVSVNAEKANALLQYNLVQTLTKLFRLLEFCLAMILLSWIFNQLPFAVKISGEYFRRLAGIIASPIFVFLLSNGIIATLIAKSGRFPGVNYGADNADTQLHEELIKNTDSNRNCPKPFLSQNPNVLLPHAATATATASETIKKVEEVVFQEKHIIISEENTFISTREKENEDHDPEVDMYADPDSDSENLKIRRTMSEKMGRKNYVKEKRQLRRSETEKLGRKNYVKEKRQLRRSETEKLGSEEEILFRREDELNDEEFHRAIEEFIARHLRFRRQESMSVVAQNQSSNIAEIEKRC
ncbi:TRNA-METHYLTRANSFERASE NON-CATALYTIC SUBUNIT TRM6MTASE SUBUNIT [Salix purpurea]|uniref:tRNA-METHYLTRANSFERASE NON-CATALYTIC SUBUNIT TRM6MTASE SUBUNIT n=1 Tax=Salix purpurea TaxID=77065 RepID=A0A9Q0WWW2_SALPP|nr:TRNA-METHYLTRANSFERASE NON-CATALYTIC SUBUNIT TRM6MTASE SUBUNIT [Salix purpurea]